MSAPLLGLVTMIYLLVSIDLLMKGNPGMSLCFLGYTIANVGLMWALR